jgi:glycerol-3-phosphate acyltransferase PlsY
MFKPRRQPEAQEASMEPAIAALAAVAGYLIGSVSFARIVSAFVAPGCDIGKTEFVDQRTGVAAEVHIYSATMVSQHLGAKWGMLTTLLDMLKIAIPSYALNGLYPGQPYLLIAALAGMIGHIWPVYYRFKGGRGLSAVYGAMLAVDPLGVLVCGFGGLILGMFVFRNVFIVFFGGVWLFIPWLWLRTNDIAYVLYAVAVNILFTLALLPELRQQRERRRAGTASNMNDALQTFPMGRGLYRMSKRLGLTKE